MLVGILIALRRAASLSAYFTLALPIHPAGLSDNLSRGEFNEREKVNILDWCSAIGVCNNSRSNAGAADRCASF